MRDDCPALRPCVALLVLFAAAHARADGQTVLAAWQVNGHAEQAAQGSQQLAGLVRSWSGPVGWRVVGLDEAAMQGAPRDPAECDRWCRDELAARVQATWILECTVSPAGWGGGPRTISCTVRTPGWRPPVAGWAEQGRSGSMYSVARGVWDRFTSNRDGALLMPRAWLHLRAGDAGTALRLDGTEVCVGACSVYVAFGEHVVDVSGEGWDERRSVKVSADSTVDFDLSARTGILSITSSRQARVRVGEHRVQAGRGRTRLRVPIGQAQVTIEDPCFHNESWPIVVAPGSSQSVHVDARPHVAPAKISVRSSSRSALDAVAVVDDLETYDLPFEGDLPLCAHVKIQAPFHAQRLLERRGDRGPWVQDVELRDERDEDSRPSFAGLAHGLQLRAGLAGRDLTELSLVDLSDGEARFHGLGVSVRSIARESGGRAGGVGVVGEEWISVSFLNAFTRASVLWLPEGGLGSFGTAETDASALPVAVLFGAGVGFTERLGPVAVGLAASYEIAPGRLDGGPAVQALVTW